MTREKKYHPFFLLTIFIGIRHIFTTIDYILIFKNFLNSFRYYNILKFKNNSEKRKIEGSVKSNNGILRKKIRKAIKIVLKNTLIFGKWCNKKLLHLYHKTNKRIKQKRADSKKIVPKKNIKKTGYKVLETKKIRRNKTIIIRKRNINTVME